ncbi:MAG: TIGR04255 family protein [Fimbriimonadaceae bacterium]|nr:TIGR04255 family protein [Fimbriimonadaceae bacterium]
MTTKPIKLARAPIVEAVVDFNCELDPDFSLASVQGEALRTFSASYPTEERQWVQEFRVQKDPDGTSHSSSAALNALQYRSHDGKQIVQVRRQGFAFNRLAPYESLDAYLPEMKSRWEDYQSMINVVIVRQVALRYINHIVLPITGDTWETSDYFKVSSSNVWGDTVLITDFLSRYAGSSSKYQARCQVSLAPLTPQGVVLDIGVVSDVSLEPTQWPQLLETIQTLRSFKNELFMGAMTDKCLQLFQ